MDPENPRARQIGMDEVLVDRMAEAVDHDGGDQQRHDEVEILVPGNGAPGRHEASMGKWVGIGWGIVAESSRISLTGVQRLAMLRGTGAMTVVHFLVLSSVQQ
jgi:hypothetical protein